MKNLKILLIEEGMGLQDKELDLILGGFSSKEQNSCSCECAVNFSGLCGCNAKNIDSKFNPPDNSNCSINFGNCGKRKQRRDKKKKKSIITDD